MWRPLVLLLGLQQPPASTARAASEAAVPWTLASNYTGEDFMNHFDFFSGKADPTGGYVNYVDRGTASDASQPGGQLASVLSDGSVVLRVDNETVMNGSATARRRQQGPNPWQAPCYVTNWTQCMPCEGVDFWGYDGDGCDIQHGPAKTGLECCNMCQTNPNCTGYSLDQGVCWLKAVESCTVKPGPPDGPYHVCSGIMPARGVNKCPDGEASPHARRSVRVQSEDTFSINDFGSAHTMLFAADIAHAPTGCAVWPAFWLLGPKWPDSGEIDILEGVNGQEYTDTTLHTNPGCTQWNVSNSRFSGQRIRSRGSSGSGSGGNGSAATLDCFVHAPGQGSNQGCGVSGPPGSIGPTFNAGGGGTFAMLWEYSQGGAVGTNRSTGSISMWFWPRGRAPAGTTNEGEPFQPKPASWGKPYAFFDVGSVECGVAHFTQLQLVFDTTLCGSWAGGEFAKSCPKEAAAAEGSTSMAKCIDYVRYNPSAFSEAWWQINSVLVWEQPPPPPPPQQPAAASVTAPT